MPSIPFTDRDKGEPVRVIAGKYSGRKGWKHRGRGETDSQIYVILKGVQREGVPYQPSKAVRIPKTHCVKFERAVTLAQKQLEQKPNLQQKLTDLVKELVKLNIAPNEDMVVTFGQQWLTMWQKKQAEISIDYNRAESPPAVPTVSDDDNYEEDDNQEEDIGTMTLAF